MKTIYCISGLGADERAFQKLQLPGISLINLPWLIPEKNETISAYASRMREGIQHPNPVLMGLSFGGIMSIEIGRQIPLEKIILISSIKSAAEKPAWMKWIAFTRLNRLVPMKSTRFTEPITNRTLGVTNQEEKLMARDFRKKASMKYTNWAVDKVLHWQNPSMPASVYHIHGDKDRIFPIKNIKPDYTVKDGGHLMIMNKAEEISGRIVEVLKR